jgi:head-tail adaptor
MLSSGDLKQRVALERREKTNDGAGNHQAAFVEQFQRRAGFVYAGGGEAIAAERLLGRSILKIRMRSDQQTRSITADWRLRDVRRGTLYAIREVDAVTDPQCVYLVVSSGVAP